MHHKNNLINSKHESSITQPNKHTNTDRNYEMKYKLTKMISVIILVINISTLIDYSNDITGIFEICTKYKTDNSFKIAPFSALLQTTFANKIWTNQTLLGELNDKIKDDDGVQDDVQIENVYYLKYFYNLFQANVNTHPISANRRTDPDPDNIGTTTIPPIEIQIRSALLYIINELKKNSKLFENMEGLLYKERPALFSLNTINRVNSVYKNTNTTFFFSLYFYSLQNINDILKVPCDCYENQTHKTKCIEMIKSFCLVNKTDFFKVLFIICQVLHIFLICFLPENYGYISRIFCFFQTWADYMTDDDGVFFTPARFIYLLLIFGVFEYIFILKKKNN